MLCCWLWKPWTVWLASKVLFSPVSKKKRNICSAFLPFSIALFNAGQIISLIHWNGNCSKVSTQLFCTVMFPRVFFCSYVYGFHTSAPWTPLALYECFSQAQTLPILLWTSDWGMYVLYTTVYSSICKHFQEYYASYEFPALFIYPFILPQMPWPKKFCLLCPCSRKLGLHGFCSALPNCPSSILSLRLL